MFWYTYFNLSPAEKLGILARIKCLLYEWKTTGMFIILINYKVDPNNSETFIN